jgi:diguanylate cyclase (GGDEF)-like protein
VKPKVLLVDDLKIIHQLLRIRLADEPLEWHSAFDGHEALEKAERLAVDLILLDVHLPDMDGFEVCRRLKSNPATGSVPIIFLSGESAGDEKVKGFSLGAVDYVVKPFDAAELLARVRVALRTRELMEMLSKRALIDGLTGLHNRAYLDERIAAETAHALRFSSCFSCIMSDLDKFKQLNDTYGHSFGDQVLRGVARVFSESCRTEDVVARYGGEEFAILTPNVAADGALVLAQRLRERMAAEIFRFEDQTVRVSCSFGVAELDPSNPQMLLACADQALYRAKRRGGNCVIAFDNMTQSITGSPLAEAQLSPGVPLH